MNILQILRNKKSDNPSEEEKYYAKRKEAFERGELNSGGYLSGEIEKVIYSLGAELGSIPCPTGADFGGDCIVSNIYFYVKLPTKKKFLGIEVPTISLADVVDEINKKCNVTPEFLDPNKNTVYRAHYTRRSKWSIEEIDLCLYNVAKNSTKRLTLITILDHPKYFKTCERLARLGLI